jgi:hypothetical protein
MAFRWWNGFLWKLKKTPETRDTSKPKNIDSDISSIYDGETTLFLEDGLPSQIDFPAGNSTPGEFLNFCFSVTSNFK